jgi:hypothetical protein
MLKAKALLSCDLLTPSTECGDVNQHAGALCRTGRANLDAQCPEEFPQSLLILPDRSLSLVCPVIPIATDLLPLAIAAHLSELIFAAGEGGMKSVHRSEQLGAELGLPQTRELG